jgi:anti-sigma factor RsiW
MALSDDEFLASYERLQAALLGGSHFEPNDFARYVDGAASAGERERIEEHARECVECTAEIAAYQELRGQIQAASLPAIAAEQPSIREKLSRFFAVSGWRLGWAAAAAAAGLAFVLLVEHRDKPASEPIVARRGQPQEAQSKPDVASLRDGGRVIRVDSSGTVAGVEDLPPQWRQPLEAAIANGRLEHRVYPDLRRRAGTLLGDDRAAQTPATLMAPLGVVTESATPEFLWKAEPRIEGRVEVYDEQFHEVAASGWIRSTAWRPPAALARGKTYIWQLTVRRNGSETKIPSPPAPEARFRVLDEQQAHDIVEARRLYPDFLVLHALLYGRAGMTEQSRSELLRLQTENPGSPTVKQLADSLDSRSSRQKPVPKP